MVVKRSKQKLRLHKKALFLGLIHKYRTYGLKITTALQTNIHPNTVSFAQFKKYYTPLLSIAYVNLFLNF